MGHFRILTREVYTNLSRTPNLRFRTSRRASLYKRPKKTIFHNMFFFFRGVAGSRGIGRFWPFGRMGNVNWGEAANQSAASAASRTTKKLQAVIKSAASAASRKTKNQGPRSRGAHGRRLGKRTAAGQAPPCIWVPWIWSSWRLR